MNEYEGRVRKLTSRLSRWWGSGRASAQARQQAKVAAAKVQDFRQSERGQQAEAKLRDLRTSETAKRAEARLRDLRASETGQKAESALSDLRQREPVKKAEESARKVMHDLFSGRSDS